MKTTIIRNKKYGKGIIDDINTSIVRFDKCEFDRSVLNIISGSSVDSYIFNNCTFNGIDIRDDSTCMNYKPRSFDFNNCTGIITVPYLEIDYIKFDNCNLSVVSLGGYNTTFNLPTIIVNRTKIDGISINYHVHHKNRTYLLKMIDAAIGELDLKGSVPLNFHSVTLINEAMIRSKVNSLIVNYSVPTTAGIIEVGNDSEIGEIYYNVQSE